jgi:hypothetical protein
VYTLFAPYSPSYSFPCNIPHPRKSLSHPSLCTISVLRFCRRKDVKRNLRNMAFLLVWDEDTYTGDSLCCFHAYVYYSHNWFISTSLLHSSLVPYPRWPQPL